MDLTLVTGPDGTVRPVAMAHDLALTPNGPVVTFAGGGTAALDWATPPPAPRLAGNRAVYPQAHPGHDLVVEATRAGFVASLRRTDPTAAPIAALALRGRAGILLGRGHERPPPRHHARLIRRCARMGACTAWTPRSACSVR